MADDKVKRRAGFKAKEAVCGVCEHTSFLCPTCPKRLHMVKSDDNHGWAAVLAQNPELGRAMLASARAARHLSTLKDDDLGYADWLTEYQRCGDKLRAIQQQAKP